MSRKPRDVIGDVDRRFKSLKKHWLDDAEEVVDIYEAEEDEQVPFNILYSNTETILPALYNSTPRPEVGRRYTQIGQQKQIDGAVAQVAERTLEYSADTNVGEYETFDKAVRGAVLNALVPGQGQVRVRYKADGNYQELCYERLSYDRFVWGYARAWTHVPWVAFGYDMSRPDFEATFPEFVKKKAYTEFKWEEVEEEDDEEAERRDAAGTKKEPTLLIWEVWTAATKRIQFVCSTFMEDFLREEDYPFALTTRFPVPEPLKFVLRNDNLLPVPPYKLYEKQAEELNEVTRRLHIVLKAIKVRGGYNGQLTELATILDGDDTALVPVENASQIAESGGFEKQIWLIPIAELVEVARVLYEAQTSAKNTIYEIMGIGDILRGTSKASETAQAQEIKNQWGSLRIKRAQKDVMAFCRDLFRISLEFAANLYTPATFKQITKLPMLTQGEKQMAQKAMIRQQMMQQQGPQQGQQPQQPQLPPEMMAGMALPTWEEVTAVLRDRFERTYRIDIETNSTVDLEATEDKAQITEFMNAFGQMTAGLQPLIESGALPFEGGKLIMGEVFRRFRFARRVEQALDLMQPPQPKEDPKVVKEKHDAEMQKVQADAKRQIGEMQETILEMTGETERLKIENKQLKAEQAIATSQQGLEKQQMTLESKGREQQLQSDYRGKVDIMKGEMSRMQDQNILAQVQQTVDQAQQQIQQLIQGAKTEIGASQQVAAAKAQTADAKAQAPTQMMDQMVAALTALAENQSAMMQAVQEVAKLAGAEREAELMVGPDGKKRSRSRVVMQ